MIYEKEKNRKQLLYITHKHIQKKVYLYIKYTVNALSLYCINDKNTH